MADVSELWTRLEAWGAEHAPRMLEDLNPSASEEQVAALEDALGLTLPPSYRDSLKRHDGEHDGWPNKVFADMGAYLPCDQVIEQHQMHLQAAEEFGEEFSDRERRDQIRDGIISVHGPVRPDTFHPAWVPFLDCNGDVFWAIDLAPEDDGTPGQIIRVDLEACDWRVIAASFSEFLEAYVTSLESGDFSVEDGRPTQATSRES